jgi:hypothetical protein
MPKRTQDQDATSKTPEAATAGAEQAGGNNKPAWEVRLARIKAIVWANPSDGGVRYNVTIRRIFKREGSATWEQSDSFGRDDLPQVMEVVRQAWLWIYGQTSSGDGQRG